MKSKADRYRLAGKVQIAGGVIVVAIAATALSAPLWAAVVGAAAGMLIYGGINDLREAKEMAKETAKGRRPR